MSDYLVADSTSRIEKEKEILDWYNKTMEYFLSKHGKIGAEGYHKRIINSLKNHPNFLKNRHLSEDRMEEKLTHQFTTMMTTIPGWVKDLGNNFASSYQFKLFSRIKRQLNCDNLDEFKIIVRAIHSDLIEEELRVHSYSRKKVNLKKSFLESLVEEKLSIICQINLPLYAETLEFHCPTVAAEDFAESFFVVERKSRKRFLNSYQTINDDFLSFLKTVLDLMAIKCCSAIILRVFSREFDCRNNCLPLTESEFDCTAEEIMSKCTVECKRVIHHYIKEAKTTQNVNEKLTMTYLKEIKYRKNQNRESYRKKYNNIRTYYDY